MIADEVEIQTGSNRLIWRENEIETIYREPLLQYLKGVRWIMRLKKSISPAEIRSYLCYCYFGSVPIYIDGERAEIGIHYLGDLIARGEGSPYRSVYIHKIPFHRESTIIVRDIFQINENRDLPGIVIFTDDPRIKLSAQRTIIHDKEYKEWIKETYISILNAIYEKYRTVDEIDRVIGISSINKCIYMLIYAYCLFNGRELFKYAIFKDEMLKPIPGSKIISQSNVKWLYLHEKAGMKI